MQYQGGHHDAQNVGPGARSMSNWEEPTRDPDVWPAPPSRDPAVWDPPTTVSHLEKSYVLISIFSINPKRPTTPGAM